MTGPSQGDYGSIVRHAISVADDLAVADVNDIFRHTRPNPGVPLADIENFELQYQLRLPAPYRSFLQVVNGWPAFYQDVDLCSLHDLAGGDLVNRGWMLVEAADEGSGGMLGISRIAQLPIAVSVTGIDVFLLMLEEPEGAVSWVAGGEVERFPSFHQFVTAMVEYNRATVEDLRSDPWLGISPP